jgi:uncharacterized membrane protein
MFFDSGDHTLGFEFAKSMTLVFVWTCYALLLAWAGLRVQLKPLVLSGLVAVGIGATYGMVTGFSYSPIENHTLILNIRVAAFLFSGIGLGAIVRLLDASEFARTSFKEITTVLKISVPLILFVLITAEAIDVFEKAKLGMRGLDSSTAISSEVLRLSNLQQLSLSGVWLVYSMLLMGIGLVRRMRSLRVIAMVVFGVTILKIFIFDLSFLETLYRIFSFIGLGLILLGVSYLYQKYKDIILGTKNERGEESEPAPTGSP